MDINVKRKLIWATLLSIVVMAFLSFKVDWAHFSSIAGRLDMKILIMACIVYMIGNLVRAARFCKLDHKYKGLAQWWHINALYNFITSTLPGGAGEAASAFVLKRAANFELVTALRILLLSRLMDLFALSLLFFVSSILISSDTPYREAAIWFSGVMFIISSIALLRSSEQWMLKLLQRLPGQGGFVKKLSEKLSELLKIADEQRSENLIGITLLQSILMMTGGIVSIHLALLAFGVDFTLVQSFYCYGVYAIFQIVPIQGIAGIGTQAAWWTLALNGAGYNGPESIAVGFMLYATYYVIVAVTASFSFFLWMTGRNKEGSAFVDSDTR